MAGKGLWFLKKPLSQVLHPRTGAQGIRWNRARMGAPCDCWLGAQLRRREKGIS